MWLALALALGATLWVASHDGGDTVEAVKSSGASASPAMGRVGQAERSAPAQVARKLAVPPPVSGSAPGGREATLAQDIVAWKQREPIGLKPEAELRAWGPSLPPPPPVVAVAKVAPPPPQAPRFPHAWVGRFNDMAVVSGPQSTWVLAEGQVIDGQWRVEHIRDRQMQLIYLPLNQAQTVAMQTP